MKKYTRKFLDTEAGGKKDWNYKKSNAKQAMRRLELPEKLWMELAKEIPCSNLRNSLIIGESKEEQFAFNSAFMAGVAIGWAERNRKIN